MKIKQETIDKINQIVKDAGCSNWKINKEDPRYIDFTCKCGKKDKKLKQQVVKSFKGCTECAKKGIAPKTIEKCKEKCKELGYTYVGLAERARSVIIRCNCPEDHLVYTSNLLKAKDGSCIKCIKDVTPQIEPVQQPQEEVVEPEYEYGEWKNLPIFHYSNKIREVKVIAHPKLEPGFTYMEMIVEQYVDRSKSNSIKHHMKFDKENLEKLQNLNKKFRAWKAEKNKTCYARFGVKNENKLLHSFLFPDFSEVDHIDHDGLNNLKSNVRDGRNKINANNKTIQKNNTTGHTGLQFLKASKGKNNARWKACWVDADGNRKSKSFSVLKCGKGDVEVAKNLAIAYRDKMTKEKLKILESQNQ